jgi:hypothetical protein
MRLQERAGFEALERLDDPDRRAGFAGCSRPRFPSRDHIGSSARIFA